MKLAAAALFLALVAAGCLGGNSDDSGDGEDAAAPDSAPGMGELVLERIASDLDQPLLVTHTGNPEDGLFIVERPGTIQHRTDGGLTVWADLRDRVGSNGQEQGLLGLAFHPDFHANGAVFVSYTDAAGTSVLSRFKANPSTLSFDETSEAILLEVDQPYGNHNGGHIAFGPDGYLYLGLGDGGLAGDPHGHGQDKMTLLGSLLRLKVGADGPYEVPSDNPFVGDPLARDEVWASGLRNPWRFSFDRTDLGGTGDLWMGDVGQNCAEEINHQPAASTGGENYGWSRYEGNRLYVAPTQCLTPDGGLPEDVVFPVHEYRHDSAGHCSVTGGVVVRDPALPRHQGNYLFGDFCTGVIWTMAGPDGEVTKALDTDLRISSFGEDASGGVNVVDLQGAVHRIIAR